MILSVILDNDGYIQQFCTGGYLESETLHTEIDEIPEDFFENYKAYRYEDGLILDKDKLPDLIAEQELENLRMQREVECFAVVNRGKLWYDRLTDSQLKELDAWYQEWLNITDKKSGAKGIKLPERPRWLE